jgi:hypothetical protein
MTPQEAVSQFKRIRMDMVSGMVVSNIIAVFIIYATSATLHATGVRNIQS